MPAINYATYTLTPNGQIDTVADANNNLTNLDYDGFDRLHRTFFAHATTGTVCAPTIPHSFTAPSCAVGQTYEELGYDVKGNVTTKRNRSDRTITFGFDNLNREIARNVQANSASHFARTLANTYLRRGEPAALGRGGGFTTTYEYDPLGRRRAKIVNGTTTKFVSDGAEEIEERDGSNNVLRKYAYGSSIDDRIAMKDAAACTGANTWCYYLTNWQGSTTTLVNQSGSLNSVYHYGPYGEGAGWTPADALTGNPFRYTGRRIDPETGLYYYRARYYSTRVGRFLQVDPVGTKDDLNLYAYVGNDPLNNVDPSGESCVDLGAEGCTDNADGSSNSPNVPDKAGADRQYMSMSGADVNVPASAVDTAQFGQGYAKNDSGILESAGSLVPGSSMQVSGTEQGVPTGEQYATLGQMDMTYEGTLTYADDGSVSFSGELSFQPDTYDFTKNPGELIRNTAIAVGEAIPSPSTGNFQTPNYGKPFTFKFTGTKPVENMILRPPTAPFR